MRDPKITHILIDLEKDLWFGLPGSVLSYRQKINAVMFDGELSQWLLDNVGKFGREWWVDMDNEHDSLRAVFKDPAMETWVMMKWCDRNDSEQCA